MVVDLVVPEDGLVTVTPEVVLGADVLVGVLGLLRLRGLVGLVLPVLEPQAVSVDTTEDDGGDDDVDGELAPEVTGGSGVVLDGSTLAVESVVGSALEA